MKFYKLEAELYGYKFHYAVMAESKDVALAMAKEMWLAEDGDEDDFSEFSIEEWPSKACHWDEDMRGGY